MRNVKKSLSKCLAIAMATTLSLTATGCALFEKSEKKKEQEFISAIGGVSETYQGAVSDQSFNTPSAAAQAFVQQEVVGDKTATIVNTQSNGELSQQEVNNLHIPDELQNGIVSVEKLVVQYKIGEGSYTSTPSSQYESVVVYVIRYADAWKYYTPAPITGDTLSKSYYESVFNYEKYKNCTVTSTMTINVSAMLVLSADLVITQTLQHEEGKIFFEQTMSLNALGETYSDYVGLYLETVGNRIECYAKTSADSEWQCAELNQVGFNSLEELTPFYDSYLDYTYFTKTDYGFRMADENAKQYVKESLEQEESLQQFVSEFDNAEMDMFVKYYVSEGVLTGIRQDGSCTLSTNIESYGDVKLKINLSGRSICGNYGTTKITKPF